MKKQKNTLMLLIMYVLVLLFVGDVCYAEEGYSEYNTYIENFLIKNDCSKELKNIKELYNNKNEVVALLYNLEGEGYIVLDIINDIISEFSFEDNSYYTDKDNVKLYNGPLNYYEIENDKIVDLMKNTSYNNNYFDNGNWVDIKVNNTVIEKTPRATSVTRRTTGFLPNYSYNPNGVCGANAAAMYFRYLDVYVNNNVIPPDLQSEVPFIKHLEKFIPAGTTSSKLYSGMINYMNSRNLNSDFYMTVANEQDVSRCISSNLPYIVTLRDNSAFGAHVVGGYGYTQYSDGDFYLIINDGYGNREVRMNIIFSISIIG